MVYKYATKVSLPACTALMTDDSGVTLNSFSNAKHFLNASIELQCFPGGIARLFKVKRQGDAGVDWDSKWRLSIDPCAKCHFIWGRKRCRASDLGAITPLAMPLVFSIHNPRHSSGINCRAFSDDQ